MGEILASVSGPAAGAAGVERRGRPSGRRSRRWPGWRRTTGGRRAIATPFTVADAVAALVKFREPVAPNREWQAAYAKGIEEFRGRMVGANR